MTRQEKAYKILKQFHISMENDDKEAADNLFGEMYLLALNTWQADGFQ